MSARVLVAGIGNIFLGDDAFGSEVARRLLRDEWPEDVRVVDFGIRGLDLTFALLDGYEMVILVDAMPRGGEPGTLYTMEADADEAAEAAVDAHSMDPMRVLAAAKSMGARWDRLLVIGCEPSPDAVDSDGPGALGMSPPVERAVESGAEIVRRLVCELTSESSPNSSVLPYSA
jgi:hydrogenase maturation protease